MTLSPATNAATNPAETAAPHGRMARKRRATRARLLHAAYMVMSEAGVDAARIKDITEAADVGFGTFYNYFASKDDLAGQTLDCLIDDLGRRNIAATQGLRRADPALVLPLSTRLVIRETTQGGIWQWWARRPDLLIARFCEGFGRFARRDIADGVERGIFRIAPGEIDQAWSLACWAIVGGIHDIAIAAVSPARGAAESGGFVVRAVAGMLGMDLAEAARVAAAPLPRYGPAAIDWHFRLGAAEDEAGDKN